jgi:hypothetical protein
MNVQGGVNPEGQSAFERAARTDLVTLPINVEGTNCANCRFVTLGNPIAFCIHPAVWQPVTARMCCALWDATGTLRPWL